MLWFSLACAPAPDAASPDHAKHVHAEHGHPNVEHAHHRFDDPQKWAKVFDDPARDAWQKPERVVEALELQPGMVVADIGAGTGYLNRHLAKAVGQTGRVVATDIEPKLVEYMAARATEEATPQVEARLTAADESGLAPGEVDRIVMLDVYHHIGNRKAYFSALRAALKPGGFLAVVDLTKEAPFGPPVDARLTPEQVKAEMVAAGWTFDRQGEGLPHQYLLRFTP